ncbi:MAG: hypothetical protein ACYSW4_02340 [Planctomycetota bacterium]|jgi:hypothetical protein
MPDSDHNIIKPVESLHNVAGLTPAKRREERKRRRDLHKGESQESEQELNESVDEESLGNELTEDETDQHSIDYCA